MIRTIMLTHRYVDAIPSTIVCSFFRMAGIYVVENYLDSATDLHEDLSEFEIEPSGNLDCFCDAEVVLLSEELDKGRIYTMDFSKVIEIRYEDASEKKQDGTDETWLINAILFELTQKGLLSKSQKDDLTEVASAFSAGKYVKTTMLTKYFFVFNDDKWIDDMLTSYRAIVQILQQSYKNNKDYPHVKFALINTAYEVNLYCIRCERTQIYSYREIVDMANELKNLNGCLPKRSLEILLAQVENNLSRDRSASYYRLTELCRNDTNVNSYVFFLKGNYWVSEEKYERAANYYKGAIARFPQYYRAWYQLGICFYNQGEAEKARKAFQVVKKILTERFEKNVLRPMEIKYLYQACMYCGRIQGSYSTFGALMYYGFAKRVWESIEKSKFIQHLAQERAGNEIIGKIKQEFDIIELEKKINSYKEYLGA